MIDFIQQLQNKNPFWGRFLILLPLFYILELVLNRAAWLHSGSLLGGLLGILMLSVVSAALFSFIGYAFGRQNSSQSEKLTEDESGR